MVAWLAVESSSPQSRPGGRLRSEKMWTRAVFTFSSLLRASSRRRIRASPTRGGCCRNCYKLGTLKNRSDKPRFWSFFEAYLITLDLRRWKIAFWLRDEARSLVRL